MGSRRVTRSQNLRCLEVQSAPIGSRPDDNQIVRPAQPDCALELYNLPQKTPNVPSPPVKPNCSFGAEPLGDLPFPADDPSSYCEGSLNSSRVMRCPPTARSRRNPSTLYSPNQSDATSQPSRMMRCPFGNRNKESSAHTDNSSTSDNTGAECTQPGRIMRCPAPHYPSKKRCHQDEPGVQENEPQTPRVMRCSLPSRYSKTFKCEDKFTFPSTSNNLVYGEPSVSSFNNSLVQSELSTHHDSGGMAESEVLKCRSGQSSYPLRALKTVPIFHDIQNDDQSSAVLKPDLKSPACQIDNESSSLNNLPNEILCMIFSYLPQLELLRNCSLVCRRWLAVASSSMLWHTLSFCGQEIPISHVCGSIRFSPMLKSITIKDRNDIDIILPVLQQNCRRLETINLVRCRPSDGSHQTLRAKFLYPFLRRAQLRNINLKGTDYRSKKFYQILSTMPDLKKLNISCSRGVSPQLISEIAMNSNLKVFKNKWHSNSIYNGPKSMTIQLPGKIDDWACAYNLLFQSAGRSLTTLEFYAAGISDSALAGLSKCALLKKLCIYNANCLASESMAAIGTLTELQELLVHNAKLTPADIVHAFRLGNLCGLKCLHFNDSILMKSDEISVDDCVQVVAEKSKKLKHLSITKCRGLTDLGVKSILTHCSGLLSLDLNGGLGISGQSFLMIPTHTPQLKLLVVEEHSTAEKNDVLKTLFDICGIAVNRVSTWKQRTTSYLL